MKTKDFFINFVIVSPQPVYVDYIGGVTVAHTLANAIASLGENVYLYADSTHPNYNIQCIPWGSKVSFDDENTIVILIAGAGEHTYLPYIPDFLKESKNIVRWLVNHQVKSYPPHNKFYKFHKYWDTLDSQNVDGYLSVIEVNKDLFYNRNQPRKGTCYLIKGNLDEEPERAIHTPNDLCIDDHLYSLPNHERMKYLADVFNSSETFISYTHLTFASVLAALCGCKSIIIPKSGISKEKFHNEIWCSKNGIAFGLDDLPRAIETLPLVPSMVEDYLSITQPNQVKQFIQDLYNWLQES
jgi:hypothetical protein